MNMNDYYQLEAGVLSFEPEPASAFAKQVAGDFNPLHDPDNKRFCVPGDLLFSVLVHHYGLHRETAVRFSGMLDARSSVTLPAELGGTTRLRDAREREVLVVDCSGEKTTDDAFITALCEQYVKFSGETFPGLLQPLMKQHNVMINPARPLVIYQSMQMSLTQLDGTDLSLASSGATLQVDGKKGSVELGFTVSAGDEMMGKGSKSMVLGGLREYDDAAMAQVVDDYNALKSAG